MTTPTTGHLNAAYSRRWLALILLCAAQFMVVLDFSLVNVALPSMQRDLGFSQQHLQWVVSAYALTFGSFLLLGGRAADLLGRRRVFMTGLGLFTLASLIGGFAQFQWVLIGARAFQGIGGAIVSPAALSILTTTFQEGSERNRALGIWGTMGASGFAVGVLLSGILTNGLSWRWVMFVNVPIGLLTLAFSRAWLSESRKHNATEQIDLAGAATATSGLILLVYAFVKAPEAGWLSTSTLSLLTGAIALLLLFVWVELRSKSPLVPFSIFRRRTLRGANLIAALLGAAGASTVFILTLYMQQVLGYSALNTGMAFLPNSLVGIVAAPIGARLITRLSVKTILISSLALLMTGLLLLMHIPVQGDFVRDLLPGTVIFGFGFVLSLITVTIAATAGVDDSDQGLASGLLSTSQQVGSALGLAILVAIATARTNALVAQLEDSQTTLPVAITAGFQTALAVGAGLMVLGILIAVFVIREQECRRNRFVPTDKPSQ